MGKSETQETLEASIASQNDAGLVYIFDTTLRDGEQCPGAAMTEDQKLEVAHRLEALGVDVIEAGFPVSSPVQFRAVQRVARELESPIIAALARAVPRDIEIAAEALTDARRKRIHTFLASSPIHMKYKLGKEPHEVVELAVQAVKQARDLVEDVEFSPEDATRSEWDFLVELVSRVVEAGATTINIPDTVGYTTPDEYGALFAHLIKHVPNSEKIRFSAHCHNDLGMATANSLAAVRNGARQIECTINGIGERAGNTAMEEVAMALRTRGEYYSLHTNIRTEEIIRSSRLVRQVTGMNVQPNKAIVGDNAFAHESGIHQDGVLKNRLTYEIMTPESVGLESNRMVLGRHSGRHAFKDRLVRLGYVLEEEEFQQVWNRFLDLADKKKEVYDEDILSLVNDTQAEQEFQRYELASLHVSAGSGSVPTATVRLIDRENPEAPQTITDAACGDGPVDAIYNVLERLTGLEIKVDRFRIQPLSEGRDAQAVASVLLKIGGRSFAGKATSTDIVEASARAYLDAINRSFTAQVEEITETL
ncbi:MAG: 2-isopropylmalate synthase [Spirochaetaceae bacterium]|nr:2-isopropylmalate synthase [Spirochaetaceae bacterium]|tara:strand:- start:158991 stop:160595 length:1605 start_codon:yes stop_codon:yes gene_type:complete